MKTNMKTESVKEFLARGGKITKVPSGMRERGFKRMQAQSKADISQVDYSALPEALKIKFGIK